MSQSNWNSALALAQQRWALYNDFDLDPETWFALFEDFGAPVVVESIRCMKNCNDSRPEKRFHFLANNCEKISKQNPRSNRIQ